MYTLVLLTAMTAGENVAEFGLKGGGGCNGFCYGGCYGYSYGSAYYGGCYGQAKWGCGCGGGCYGGGWAKCHGGACYGSCYGGCYGVGYTCTGGCWGASYGCYGPAPSFNCGCGGGYGPAGYNCGGGCGGYMSAAYGVPAPVIGVGAAPADGKRLGLEDAPLGNRARLVFTLPEGAKLYVDGVLVEKAAEQKAFRTPELTPGQRYFYDAKVELSRDGKTLTGTKRIFVTAGATVEEDLTTVAMRDEVLVTTK